MSGSSETEKSRQLKGEFDNLKSVIKEVGEMLEELYKEGEILGMDLETLVLALNNISESLLSGYYKKT